MLLNWILVPALLVAIFLGLGLGLRRIAGDRGFHAALLLPAGYAGAVVVTSLLTWSSATTVVAAPALVVLALAGWAVSVRSLDPAGALRRNWRWIAGSLAAFLLFGASVILSGHPTFTGYTQIVDIGHQFDFAAYLADQGRETAPIHQSAALDVVSRTLVTGYPSGSQALLGAIGRTFGIEIAWAYQPMMAVLSAALFMVAYRVLRLVVAARTFAAVGAFAAAQASALIAYGQAGGIKELSGATMLLLATALTARFATGREGGIPAAAEEAETAPAEGRAGAHAEPATETATSTTASEAPASLLEHLRATLPITLAVSAALAIFSLTIAPWLGIVALGALIIAARTLSLRTALIRGGVAITTLVVLTLPTLVALSQTSNYTSTATSDEELGNLAARVDPLAASGVWLSADHRFPITGTLLDLSRGLSYLVLALALAGLVVAVRRRAWPLVALGLSALVALPLMLELMGPWVEFKAIVLTGPIALLLAATALSAGLRRRPLAIAGWAALLGLLAANVYADSQRYRVAALAPYDRLAELHDFGQRFDGVRNTLLSDGDELGEYMLRRQNAQSAVNSPWEPTAASKAARPDFHFDWDLDELEPAFVQRHDLIVLRRSPGQSRPPGNYAQVAQGRFYTVWKRTGEAPIEHAPLSATPIPADRKACKSFLVGQRLAPELVVAPGAAVAAVAFDPTKHSGNFVLAGNDTAITAMGPGRALGQLDAGRGGRFDIFVAGITRRPVEVTIDGRELVLGPQLSYTGRPTLIATIELGAGTHPVALTRPGGSLAPGTSEPTVGIGPVYAVPAGQLHPAPVRTAPGQAECLPQMDWIEADR